jgi:hypothetical protein
VKLSPGILEYEMTTPAKLKQKRELAKKLISAISNLK